MRVTVHLDTFDRLAPGAYAIVWIDKEAGKWSREGHAGVELPQWGHCRSTREGTCLAAGDNASDCCMIEGLDLTSSEGPFEGEHGRVQWHGCGLEPVAGDWHVQCVDSTPCVPEEVLFADEAEDVHDPIRFT